MKYQPSIAVLVPCHNEELTVVDVVNHFQEALPRCTVYVYDNNSTDNTMGVAKTTSAIVRSEPKKGKGNVVRRMFADIEADIYVLVDGDNTYDASAASTLVNTLLEEHLDMVVGARVEETEKEGEPYRFGHRFGNKLFSSIIAKLFGAQFNDVFSGYRVFSKRFVKSFPAASSGFEIETELTIHCLELRLPSAELPTKYIGRPEGSESKLNSYKDGFRILFRIALLLKVVRPMFFFGILFALLFVGSIGLFTPVLLSYLKTGLVQRFPTAILSMGVMLLAFMSLGCGLILDNVCQSRRSMKRFFYLSQPKFNQE